MPREGRAHLWPEVLPGSEVLIYNVIDDGGLTTSRLVAETIVSGEKSVLARGRERPLFPIFIR